MLIACNGWTPTAIHGRVSGPNTFRVPRGRADYSYSSVKYWSREGDDPASREHEH